MKKFFLSLVILFIVLFASFLIIGIVRKVQIKKEVEHKISSLPAFSFLTLQNEFYNSTEIRKGPVLVVHYHPECEHCQFEISEILKNNIPALFTKVILVSGAHPDSIRKFLKRFNYSEYPSVLPLVDTSDNFEKTFGKSIVPSSYIYNSKLYLVKFLHGEVKSESILKYLQESE
jgi:hypothetical protein